MSIGGILGSTVGGGGSYKLDVQAPAGVGVGVGQGVGVGVVVHHHHGYGVGVGDQGEGVGVGPPGVDAGVGVGVGVAVGVGVGDTMFTLPVAVWLLLRLLANIVPASLAGSPAGLLVNAKLRLLAPKSAFGFTLNVTLATVPFPVQFAPPIFTNEIHCVPGVEVSVNSGFKGIPDCAPVTFVIVKTLWLYDSTKPTAAKPWLLETFIGTVSVPPLAAVKFVPMLKSAANTRVWELIINNNVNAIAIKNLFFTCCLLAAHYGRISIN